MFEWAHWLSGQTWFIDGSNFWQWITSLIALGGWGLFFHDWHSNHCRHCWRKGAVPVKDTHRKVCEIHAEEFGHTH